ncbi:MAG: hypothetical protein C6W55_10385 [Thermobacillus sp.]|uniref:YopX family protein n=1 Tax=Thermobacillus sp. TaxID=2108467 RepID=UPI000E3746C9|nr:YopX family protein [Thermobacillus sp.]REK54731.1 MAG: hypothetical protein C6W55_10385 [Thermobacillus sp.]
MRQYRGRIKDSTVWVYGYYTKSPQGIARIWSPITKDNGESYLYDYVVDPETVGQSTGLKDKNGKEIYEGDILESNHKLFRFEVIWSEDWAMFTVKGGSVEALIRWATYCEVIGNIYENPELLTE